MGLINLRPGRNPSPVLRITGVLAVIEEGCFALETLPEGGRGPQRVEIMDELDERT